MANHLIIGLGGTGGKVLREFRRRLFEEYGTNNLENPKDGEYFEYVYVDSSDSDLNEKWETMATDLSLGNAQKVNIHSVPSGMLADLKKYPGLNAFMAAQNVADMKAKIGQAVTAGIGGQRRRLGRMLLASNLADGNNQQNFENTIRGAVGRLHKMSGKEQVTIHICAGLAGGTGSGTVVDAISLVRKWFPYNIQTHNNKILLLLYVPESLLVNNMHDAGYYQANGYAALQEINAVALGQYKPYDLNGRLTPTGIPARIDAGFEAAYVYSNTTEHGNVKDLQKRLPTDVAEFLFQSISMSGGQLQRLTDCENNPPTPENDQSGMATHSRQFMTFGVARVEYPEVEIQQYASYRFALQTTRALLYNYWVKEIGYDVRPSSQIGLTLSSEVREAGTLQRLHLTDEYLTLGQPIEGGNSTNWQSLKNTWKKYANSGIETVKNHFDKKDWCRKFSDMMQDFNDNKFRGMGVAKFYDIQSDNLVAYASLSCQYIEHELFKEWIAGAKSIAEIAKFVSELLSASQERITAYDASVAKEQEEGKKSHAAAVSINRDYSDLHILRTHASMLNQYAAELEKKYVHETNARALQYAKELLTHIATLLGSLQNTLAALIERFAAFAESAQKEAAARCMDAAADDGIIRQYDPKQVREIVKELEVTRKNEDTALAAIRKQFVAMIGNEDHETFSMMKDKVDERNAVRIIIDSCEQVAIAALRDYGATNPGKRLVDVSILEKLRAAFTKPGDLTDFVQSVLSGAECNFQADNTQSATVTDKMPKMIQLRLPEGESNEDKQFRQNLIAEFAHQFAGFNVSTDVALSDKNNRIVVVGAWSNMPLRVMRNTSIMKEKYDGLVSRNNPESDFNRMLLHTENFAPNDLPLLFDPTAEEVLQMAFEPLLLAFAMDMLPRQNDPMRGEEVYTLQEATPAGIMPHVLGKDFAECWASLGDSHKLTTMLTAQVDINLLQNAVTKPQKNDMVEKIKTVLQQHVLTSLCDGNTLHPMWRQYNQDASTIIEKRLI